MAVYQSEINRLNYRHREQPPSHTLEQPYS
jgi:hypothetical protein